MSITEPRLFYKPFEYQQAFDYYKNQHRVHWLADEVPLASDINDWKLKLTESEKNLIGNILKSFAQTEVHVNDYWSTNVSAWFPKPEIQAMARVFADFESIYVKIINGIIGIYIFKFLYIYNKKHERIYNLWFNRSKNK
jgi:ribonucleoside-diphosphate reductase beta chain